MSHLFDQISPKDGPGWHSAVNDFSRYRIQRFILHPEQWANCRIEPERLRWTKIKFCKDAVQTLPKDRHGIYSFIAQPDVAGHTAVGYLLYIGKAQTQSLQDRVSNYLHEANSKKCRVHIVEMLRHCPDHLWLHYAEVDDPQAISEIENSLIKAFLPPFNRVFPATIKQLISAVFK
jgi:hypothetical protein